MAGVKHARAPLAYSAEEAAEACGVSRSLFLREVKDQVFPRFVGSKPVYLADDLKAWLDSRPFDRPR